MPCIWLVTLKRAQFLNCSWLTVLWKFSNPREQAWDHKPSPPHCRNNLLAMYKPCLYSYFLPGKTPQNWMHPGTLCTHQTFPSPPVGLLVRRIEILHWNWGIESPKLSSTWVTRLSEHLLSHKKVPYLVCCFNSANHQRINRTELWFHMKGECLQMDSSTTLHLLPATQNFSSTYAVEHDNISQPWTRWTYHEDETVT